MHPSRLRLDHKAQGWMNSPNQQTTLNQCRDQGPPRTSQGPAQPDLRGGKNRQETLQKSSVYLAPEDDKHQTWDAERPPSPSARLHYPPCPWMLGAPQALSSWEEAVQEEKDNKTGQWTGTTPSLGLHRDLIPPSD
ncbi:Formin-1 [Manis pentadactyla]|nr:Formin-1 [Manis pentadactyla]